MTADRVTHIAQSNPVPTLAARWGTIADEARRKVAALEDTLRELDQVTEDLKGHGHVVATDLGVTGNSARTAWQAAQADKTTAGFALPQVA